MKLLIWLVVVWAVVVWMQRAKKNVMRRARDAAAQAAAGAAPGYGAGAGAGAAAGSAQQAAPAIEHMVQCAQCGIHFPKSEAIQARGTGKVFCCIEHRELHTLDAGVR